MQRKNLLDKLANGTPKEVLEAKEQIAPTGVVEGFTIQFWEKHRKWMSVMFEIPPNTKDGEEIFIPL